MQGSIISICRIDCLSTFNHNDCESSTDYLSKNEVAGRAFKTFLKYGRTGFAETSLFTSMRFDAVMTDAVDSLATFITSNEFIAFIASRNLNLHRAYVLRIKIE